MTYSSSYALGLCFLVIISVLWTMASMVVQHLYNDMYFHSPFLVVYVGTSLFSIFLPSRLMYERCSCGGRRRSNTSNDEIHDFNSHEKMVIIPWKNHARGGGSGGEGIDLMTSSQSTTSLGDNRQYVGTSTVEEDYSPSILPPPQSQSSPRNYNITPTHTMVLSHQDHISMASKVAPLWFISNYFYATSLEWTSIASSTVLASMGSIFAFAFATCSRYGDERVTKWKMLGVALCFAGGVATAWTDMDADHEGRELENDDLVKNSLQQRSFLGDCAGLFSAIGYGAYTVLLRHLCPKDEDRMSMQLLFGYIGALNMFVLLPVAIWVIINASNDDNHDHDSSEESDETTDSTMHTTLTRSVFLYLILKGLLDNVLSDYLWARAVILTSATVASVGVGLTIPMAFLADWIMGKHNNVTSGGDVVGAVFVLFGFVFVNVDGEKMERRIPEEEEEDADGYEDNDCTTDVVSAVDDTGISNTERFHFRLDT